MVATVAILIVPVTLQIVSRYTALIPSWIWTEELSRFLFIWMIMLGAMIAVREGTHFVVDVWPPLRPRANALLSIVRARSSCWCSRWCSSAGASSSCASAGTSIPSWPNCRWCTSSSRGRSQASHGLLFLGEIFVADLRCAVTQGSGMSERRRPFAGTRRRCCCSASFSVLMVAARAGGLRARTGVPADPGDRAAPVADGAVQRDLQGLQLVHPARGAVLPADRKPDERGRHHGPAGAAVARWSATSRARSRRST